MFDAVKRFIRWKKDKIEESPAPFTLPNLGIDMGLPKSDRVLVPMPVTVDDDYANNILNKTKKDVKYNVTPERGFMTEKYLVVLDTSNRPEVTDRGLKGGLKNFYFIAAANPDQARQIVLGTFARSPDVVRQIQYALTVTPLGKISPHINEQTPVWSYIPLRKGSKAPGQQSTPPAQAINPNNPDEVVPMSIPPVPITPPSQNDTPALPKTLPDANPMAAFMSPTLPDGSPNPMLAMMQMMMTAMGKGTENLTAANAPVSTITRGDPDNDPELAARLAEVRSTAGARHINSDPDSMDEELSGAERRAASEVENFKTLGKTEQAARGLTGITNDVDPNLMNQMKSVMGRMGRDAPPDDTPSPKKKRNG